MSKHEIIILTTDDNPYDFFKETRQWLMFDIQMGYNTLDYLGREYTFLENNKKYKDLSEEELTALAIDNIVKNDPIGKYVKKTIVEEIETIS